MGGMKMREQHQQKMGNGNQIVLRKQVLCVRACVYVML